MATPDDVTPQADKPTDQWVTGDEPMTGPQKSYLTTLAQEAGEDVPDDLTKAAASELETGSDDWYEAVGKARAENGEHLDEEEREGMPDFIKSASHEVRHELAMKWLRFWQQHPDGEGIDTGDRDPEAYIEANS